MIEKADIEFIKSYYEITVKGMDVYIREIESLLDATLITKERVILTFGFNVCGQEEANAAVANGNVMETSRYDLIQAFK